MHLFAFRRFPTASNIARRMAEQKEKLDRGEVLFEPKNRFEKSTVFLKILTC